MEILFSLPFYPQGSEGFTNSESSQGIELQGIELQGTLYPLPGFPQSMDFRPHTSHGYQQASAIQITCHHPQWGCLPPPPPWEGPQPRQVVFASRWAPGRACQQKKAAQYLLQGSSLGEVYKHMLSPTSIHQAVEGMQGPGQIINVCALPSKVIKADIIAVRGRDIILLQNIIYVI